MSPRSHPNPPPRLRIPVTDRLAPTNRFTPEGSRRRPGGAAVWPGRSAPGSARERGARAVALLRDETGAATAEYAVILLAAVGFAGLLLVILRGDDVRGMLTELVHRALTTAG